MKHHSYRDILVCTVGASLIASAKRPDASEELKRLFDATSSNDLVETMRILEKIENPSDKRWGAEINSVASIVTRGLLSSRWKIFLLVSDTPEGELVGNILKLYFLHNKNGLEFKNVEIVKVEKLNDKNRFEFKVQGLRNLVREMANCVRSNLERTIINATGGYKAAIAYAVLLGQALKVPVYYQFESFDEVIELLPLPVRFDPALYKAQSRMFAMLDYVDIVEEDRFLKKFNFQSWASVPAEIKIFIERVKVDSKHYLSLNPLGQIYLETIEWDCSTIEDPDYRTDKSPSSKIVGTGGHAIKLVQWNKVILEKIAKLPWIESIKLTGSSEIESGNDWKIYVEKDHLKLSLSCKYGVGFFTIQTVIKSKRFLECVAERIENLLREDKD
ncbi:MAG: putative CRISPR-associated protein [Pseudothermotoga sp.]|nr:putative CRISPR-associated protein [Pseudothermotoga sp.]